MDELKIGFAQWPFAKGEKAKLIKISKPYSVSGRWFINAVYLSDISRHVKWHKHFFGDLHLLIVGADYIDSKKQKMPESGIIDIDLSQQSILHKRPTPYLHEDKLKKHEFDYYTFGINCNGRFFVIPLHELLRAVLASDVFWLNQVTMLDSIDTRVIYEKNAEDLMLYFLFDVPVKYVQMDQKIKHIAWIYSNPEIYEMLNQTYQNMINGEGIKFDFLFDEIHLTAKVEAQGQKVYVKEIIACRDKKINCGHIIVYHPRLVEYEKESDDKEKQWTPNEKSDGNTVLANDKTAILGILDIEQEDFVCSEYSSFTKIDRIKTKKSGGIKTTSRTKKVKTDKKNKRTTGDAGGIDTVPQLEFEHHITEKLEGAFAEILEILRLMKDEAEVVSVGYHIGELNHHFRYREICTLDDGRTPRQYFSGIIRLNNGHEAIIIEVEREAIKLSTLLLISEIPQKWNLIYHKILQGLIKNSGSWPNIDRFGFEQIKVHRLKHTKAGIVQKENCIFGAIK